MTRSSETGRASAPLWSDEVLVLLRPAEAFATLAMDSTPPTSASSLGVLVRRPLGMALALGAAVSFLNGGHLGPARLLPSMLCWSFVPISRTVAFVVAATLLVPRDRRTRAMAHLYGASQGPWYVWLLGVSLLHLVNPLWPADVTDVMLALTLTGTVAWSLRVRFAFLRTALGLSARRALFALVLMGLLFWGVVAAFLLATDQLVPRILGWR